MAWFLLLLFYLSGPEISFFMDKLNLLLITNSALTLSKLIAYRFLFGKIIHEFGSSILCLWWLRPWFISMCCLQVCSSFQKVKINASKSVKKEKFSPRFDGLRFIETLVTAHRWTSIYLFQHGFCFDSIERFWSTFWWLNRYVWREWYCQSF